MQQDAAVNPSWLFEQRKKVVTQHYLSMWHFVGLASHTDQVLGANLRPPFSISHGNHFAGPYLLDLDKVGRGPKPNMFRNISIKCMVLFIIKSFLLICHAT